MLDMLEVSKPRRRTNPILFGNICERATKREKEKTKGGEEKDVEILIESIISLMRHCKKYKNLISNVKTE